MVSSVITLFTTRSDFFLTLLLQHLALSGCAVIIAIVLGGAIGILIERYRSSSKVALGIINFVYTIPSIALFGLLIPFSGIGNGTAIIALTVYALLPMVRNTYTGLSGIDPAILQAAQGMGSTRCQTLWRIKVPLAAPVILAGIRSMTTMTIALAGIASFIGAGGLGVAIYRGITTNNMPLTVGGSLLIAVLALLVDAALGAVEKLAVARQRSQMSRAKKSVLIVFLAILVVALGAGIATAVMPKQEGTIKVATKPMTEQYILGSMIKQTIEADTGYKVDITSGVGGGTANIEPAIEKGAFDLYPEYTGTGWNQVLKEKGLYAEKLFPQLKKNYEDNLNLTWVGRYGFNNTYGLAVRKELAQKYKLETYSDLARVAPQLVFGAEYDFFERADGYEPLVKEYGLKFKSTRDMDIGLKYQAIKDKKIDVVNIFTTDGQLTSSDVKVLRDDKGFYPSYLCYNVVRKDALTRFPELREELLKLQDIITDADMAAMNYAVEVEKKEPEAVAHDYLVKKGVLK